MKKRVSKIGKVSKVLVFFFLIVVLTSFASAYVRSVSYTGSTLNLVGTNAFTQSSLAFDKSMCQEGTDFIVQIVPYSCQPAVVRSDLLEEEDVPVFCQLAAVQINPLVDVEAIRSMHITQKEPVPGIKTIGYLPSQSALGLIPSGELENPVLNNLGYVVIIVGKNANESSMPDYINGTLNAKIRYDVENAWGVGKAEFLLPSLTDNEWKERFRQYGFWKGNGYLRASGITDDEATIYVYADATVATSLPSKGEREYSQLGHAYYELQVGEESPEIYLPGFHPCMAGLKLKLNGVEDPDTRVRLRVNEEVVEVKKNEEFLDGECSVQEINSRGLYQYAKIRCRGDEGVDSFELSISPRVRIEIRADKKSEKDYEAGDYLGNFKDRYVYVGYVGSKSDSEDVEDLFVVLVAYPQHQGNKLNAEELRDISTYVKHRTKEAGTGAIAWDALSGAISKSGSLMVALLKKIGSGEDLRLVRYGGGQEFKDAYFSVIGFAENSAYSSLISFDKGLEENYQRAMEDFEVVIGSYANEKREKDFGEETLGEKALYEAIIVSNRLRLYQEVEELCIDFDQKYPNSDYWSDLENVCYNDYLASSSGTTEHEIMINGKIKRISFQKVIEPTFEEYGAKVLVTSHDGKREYFELEKDEIWNLSFLRDNPEGYEEEYFSLESLDEDSAKLEIRISENFFQKVFKTDTRTLELEKEKTFGGYTFYLTEINLEKVAKVSVNPIINNEFSNSSFPFSVAIEKRAIQLSPEKIESKIENLDKSIESLEKTVNFLGKTVEWGNRACLATGAVLWVKNFIQGMNGGSIARTAVMQGSGGWNERCQKEISEEKYKSLDQCFLAHAEDIDRQVEDYTRNLEAQQEQLKACNQIALSEEEKFLEQRYVDEDTLKRCLAGEFSSKGVKGFDVLDEKKTLEQDLAGVEGVEDGKFFKDPDKTGEKDEYIDLNKLDSDLLTEKELLDRDYSIDDLKEIEFYRDVLADPEASSDSKDAARTKLYSLLGDLNVQGETNQQKTTIKSQSGMENVGFFDPSGNANLIPVTSHETFSTTNYKDYGYSEETKQKENYIISSEDYVYVWANSLTGTAYLLVYDEDGIVQKTYAIDYSKEELSLRKDTNELGVRINKVDKSSFHNRYDNPKLQYFDSGVYEGYPAVVPFDRENGWYAATKFVLGEGRTIASYDESGVLRFYYICNVGENGLEEYMGGDDSCGAINAADSFEDSYFVLEEGKKRELVAEAKKAIEAAQLASKNAREKVRIGGDWYEVGEPKFDTPTIQCQDFMSPKDCVLLYNVCDPFVCPSSRCDLGGNYPVRDVAQTGIIGSIALCYPNAKWHGGEVYVPICITGVYAGLDGWLQVKKLYRDCLQTQLDSGEVVGICDATQSIYICDFFYRQLRPFMQYLGSKLLNVVRGEGVHRGGGEYMNVKNALSKAKGSVDYFKQYYAAEAYRAFKLRSATELNLNDPCNTFSSVLFPNSVEVLDSLTQARSPVQFTGKFDEIQMTTRTNPPISHYKVFYQIYAGNTAGAYYKVYLRWGGGSSYYFGTFDRIVATDYLGVGESASEAVDFQAPSGYTKLCILVNGHEECGFKQVSTKFWIDYTKDLYMTQQANQTDIRTQEDCISGTASLYSILLNINPQAAAEELLDPAIYNRGIQRVCRPQDPGLGIDNEAGTQNARWVKVGYCDDKNIGCWLDTDSVREVIDAVNLEESVLETTSQSLLDQMFADSEEGYLKPEEFEDKIKEFRNLPQDDYEGRIEFLNEFFDRLFWSSQKGLVYFLRGKTYADSIFVDKCEQGICDDGNLYLAFKTSKDGDCEISGIVKEYCEVDCYNGACIGQEEEEEEESMFFALKEGEEYTFQYNREDYTIKLLDIDLGDEDDFGDDKVKISLKSFKKDFGEYTIAFATAERFDLDGDGDNDIRLSLSKVEDEEAEFKFEIIEEEEEEEEDPFAFFSSGDFSSSEFTFNTGEVGKLDHCYWFNKTSWWYGDGCNGKNNIYWIEVNKNPKSYLDNENSRIVKNLVDKNYLEGLKFLLDEVTFLSSNPNFYQKFTWDTVLRTIEDTPYLYSENNKVKGFVRQNEFIAFVYGYGNYNFLRSDKKYGMWFKFTEDQGWVWSFTNGDWKPVTQINTDGNEDAVSKGANLEEKEIELLNLLQGKNFIYGMTILYENIEAGDIFEEEEEETKKIVCDVPQNVPGIEVECEFKVPSSSEEKNKMICEPTEDLVTGEVPCSVPGTSIKTSLVCDTSNLYSADGKVSCFVPEEEPSSCPFPPEAKPSQDVQQLPDATEKVLQTLEEYEGRFAYIGPSGCFSAVDYIYNQAGVVRRGENEKGLCVYSDYKGKQYTTGVLNDPSKNPRTIGVDTNAKGNIIYQVPGEDTCTMNSNPGKEYLTENEKLDAIKPGDIISYVYNEYYGHNVIFVEWTNKAQRKAKVFDWNGRIAEGDSDNTGDVCDRNEKSYRSSSQGGYCKTYRYVEVDLSDNQNSVYMFWRPSLN